MLRRISFNKDSELPCWELNENSFLLSLCKYTFLFIIHTKTLNLIGSQVVHFCLTTYNGIYSMREFGDAEKYYQRLVLILVVMEYTQWVNCKKLQILLAYVLILVVMEYTQWVKYRNTQNSFQCLNPCCNGIYSMSCT